MDFPGPPEGGESTMRQQIEAQFAGRGEFPGATALDQSAARVFTGFGFVDSKQLKFRTSADFG